MIVCTSPSQCERETWPSFDDQSSPRVPTEKQSGTGLSHRWMLSLSIVSILTSGCKIGLGLNNFILWSFPNAEKARFDFMVERLRKFWLSNLKR